MAEYHVGCGFAAIYAGTVEPKNKTVWRDKTECTREALSAVAQYLLFEKKEFRFQYESGDYVLKVIKRGGT